MLERLVRLPTRCLVLVPLYANVRWPEAVLELYSGITLAGVASMDAGAFSTFTYQMFRYEALEAFVS